MLSVSTYIQPADRLLIFFNVECDERNGIQGRLITSILGLGLGSELGIELGLGLAFGLGLALGLELGLGSPHHLNIRVRVSVRVASSPQY